MRILVVARSDMKSAKGSVFKAKAEDVSGGRGGVRIRTTDDVRAAEIVASLDWVSEVVMQDGAMMVIAPPDRSSEISAALSERGIHISEIIQTRESLEEYFLKVTGEDTQSSEEQMP